ncbi:MAG: cytochrome c oxidase subunit II [Pseudomonadota bacterium]|nr:cytochrome c oxidase subunit II [Pseudomonadota bacterium]
MASENISTGAPIPWQMNLQPAATPIMEQLAWFHDHILLVICIAISVFVMALLGYACWRFSEKRHPHPSRTTHHTLLEVVWTVLPVVILVVIAIPSFKILYDMDRTEKADLTLKITGFQWAWEYTYPDNGDITFESYVVPDRDLKPGQIRLLSTDNPIVLPVNRNIRLLVTARDVIHSWAMPAWGVKKDAVPGRLNETWARVEREGVYFGQCSEICGTNHAFMPAEVWVVPWNLFEGWAALAKTDLAKARQYLVDNWAFAPGHQPQVVGDMSGPVRHPANFIRGSADPAPSTQTD